VGLSYGLSSGLRHGLSYGLGLSLGLNYGLNYGLDIGPGVGIIVMLVHAILASTIGPPRFAERIHWTWRGLLRPEHLRSSLDSAGAIFLLIGLHYGLSTVVTSGLSYGLDIGLIYGLSYWTLQSHFCDPAFSECSQLNHQPQKIHSLHATGY
jgi:hypothetical protein